MLNNCYDVETSPNLLKFEFTSIGLKGNIVKVVRYTETDIKGVYNLGFGDKNPITGRVSDIVVTNNNDSQKVLATVASTLYAFTANYPEATIIATGSTEARTRLYRMGITRNLIDIEKDFVVWGFADTVWEPFRRNTNYEAFLVRRIM